jgi:hypothetical protein
MQSTFELALVFSYLNACQVLSVLIVFLCVGGNKGIGDFISVESRTHLRLSLPCGAHTASVFH